MPDTHAVFSTPLQPNNPASNITLPQPSSTSLLSSPPPPFKPNTPSSPSPLFLTRYLRSPLSPNPHSPLTCTFNPPSALSLSLPHLTHLTPSNIHTAFSLSPAITFNLHFHSSSHLFCLTRSSPSTSKQSHVLPFHLPSHPPLSP